MFCQNGASVSVLSVQTGLVKQELGKSESNDEPEDNINSFNVDDSSDLIVTHHASSLFKLWNWKGI